MSNIILNLLGVGMGVGGGLPHFYYFITLLLYSSYIKNKLKSEIFDNKISLQKKVFLCHKAFKLGNFN